MAFMHDERDTLLRPSAKRPAAGDRFGLHLEVDGTVQGVGFRPFVYRLATELELDGFVRNAGSRVVIEATGSRATLDELIRRLTADAPPLARVAKVTQRDLCQSPAAGRGFRVEVSDPLLVPSAGADISPDIATCDECLHDLFDVTDRRYRYAFVNCTNCGPRATIIDSLPYDRARTVMREFTLCADCSREYADTSDRRFHAEPIACPTCGPQLAWHASNGATQAGDAALRCAEDVIASGGVVAIKGLGGYQLVCDATRSDSIATLRERKGRPRKPLAVMAADVDGVKEIAIVSPAEEVTLMSSARPIVVVASAHILPENLHPGSDRLGVFLPYTPLHHLLLRDLRRPLVVTSGNRGDQPMVLDNERAERALHGIADGYLHHDREIAVRYDDSVVAVVDARQVMVRRARGYAPRALKLPIPARVPIVGVGAELKHTFTLASGDRAIIGPHTGDLENVDAFDSFERTLAHMSRLEHVTPELVAHDLHPGYLSTQFAMRWSPAKRVGVQHHHAHVAACAAEFAVQDPFIGVAYDGLGMGDDGTLWGGEVLIADLVGYRRFGRFSHAPLPGGAAAVRRPARMALGYLFGAEGFDAEAGLPASVLADAAEVESGLLQRLDSRETETIRRLIGSGLNCPQTSSAGRLFDAVSSLLGIRDDASYEGEAAVMLESAAAGVEQEELPWSLRDVDGLLVYDVRPTLVGVLHSVAHGTQRSATAAAFHQTVAAVTYAMCEAARDDTGLSTVCLSGGVFQNQRLLRAVTNALVLADFVVHVGAEVPANDGGISFGQAAVAAARSRKD